MYLLIAFAAAYAKQQFEKCRPSGAMILCRSRIRRCRRSGWRSTCGLLGHDIGFGIGIAHGFARWERLDSRAGGITQPIGTVSNVASRLCDEAKPGQILISPPVLLAVDKAVTVEPVGEFNLKGIRRPMAAYNVLSSAVLPA